MNVATVPVVDRYADPLPVNTTANKTELLDELRRAREHREVGEVDGFLYAARALARFLSPAIRVDPEGDYENEADVMLEVIADPEVSDWYGRI